MIKVAIIGDSSSTYLARLDRATFESAGLQVQFGADANLDTWPDPVANIDAYIVLCDTPRLADVLIRLGAAPTLILGPPIPESILREAHSRSVVPRLFGSRVTRHHPSLSRAISAVHSGEIGLLRAVHVDVLLNRASSEDLVSMAAESIDAVTAMAGPVWTSAYSSGNADRGWTATVQFTHDVVVTMRIETTFAETSAPVLQHRYRVLGTHGTIAIDLLRPALRVLGSADLPRYGELGVTSWLRSFHDFASRPDAGPSGKNSPDLLLRALLRAEQTNVVAEEDVLTSLKAQRSQ